MQANRWVILTIGVLIISIIIVVMGIRAFPIAQRSSDYVKKNVNLMKQSVSAAPETTHVKYNVFALEGVFLFRERTENSLEKICENVESCQFCRVSCGRRFGAIYAKKIYTFEFDKP